MSERLNIYHKTSKDGGNLGIDKDFIGLTNGYITDSTILIFLKQYLTFQKNNDRSMNKIYEKEKSNEFMNTRNKKILKSLFSINNETQTFYDIEEIESVETYMEDFKSLYTKKEMDEKFDFERKSQFGFDFDCDNGRMFLKNDDNKLPKVGFLNLEETYLNDKSLYSYKMMNRSEFRSFTLINHMSNYDEVFEMYNKEKNTQTKTINENLDEFISILKDSLEKIKEELQYYKQSNIIEFIKNNSTPYTQEEIELELPFIKKEKGLLSKKVKKEEKLGTIMLKHLNGEKEKLNNSIEKYLNNNKIKIGNSKQIEDKINYIKNNYNKRIDLLCNFVEKNVENKIENKIENTSTFNPTIGI